MLDEIVLLEFRGARIRPEGLPAGNYVGRPAGLKKVSGARCPVALEIVIAQDHDDVGCLRRFLDHPESTGEPQDGMAHQIKDEEEREKSYQEKHSKNDPAMFGIPAHKVPINTQFDFPGSTWRKRSAATSGSVPLK